MKAEAFDNLFDDGEDISHLLDLSSARRPNQEQKRVNVDFPQWMVDQLDTEARRVGVTRQSIIKVWLAERLEQVSSNKHV
ncbi:type II toxin-antitoxin system BrnA family antitoxin [Pseudomonadota bacterium]